jgi:hypothetical protein
VPLADIYHQSKFDIAKLIKFLEMLGAYTKIKLIRTTCDQNPQKAYLHAAPGALRANKRETFDWLKFTLEGEGERTHGYAFEDTAF